MGAYLDIVVPKMGANMITRIALHDFSEWLNRVDRKPMLLRGARQVGKTRLVREFAASQRLPLWEVNLEKNRNLNTVFESLDVNTILRELSLVLNTRGVGTEPGILFLDEIQETPHALTALRYFYEERPDIPLVAAGSLLEFSLGEGGFSMPVGRSESYWLGPLSFSEYLLGTGDDLLHHELQHYQSGASWPLTAHERLMDRLREYLIVGGMPEAAQAYINSGNLADAVRVHTSLLETYRDDFSKYAHGALLRKLQRVFETAPLETGRKVTYRRFHPDWRTVDIRRCVELLTAAGILVPVYHSAANGLPLGAEENPDVYKLYLLDVGLAGTAAGNSHLSLEEFRTARFLSDFINTGSLAEQFVCQQIWSSGSRTSRPKLHYWLREGKTSNAEVDFVLPGARSPVPVEIKAGATGSLRSLHQFMLRSPSGRAIRLDASPPSSQQVETTASSKSGRQSVGYQLESYPLYFAGRLRDFAVSDSVRQS